MATTWTRQSVNSANQVVSSSSPTTEWSRVKIVTDLGVNTLSLSEVDYLTDSNGTGTLKNIDAIDATTEATIESAIDTLSNLTSIGTITTGVWNASAIGDSYISSASTWNAKQNALTFGISNTNAVKIDAADVADDDYARFTANGLEGRTLAEIKSDIGTGNGGLVPATGTTNHFLKHDGTFGSLPTFDFDLEGDSGDVNVSVPGDTITIAGGTGITTAVSGHTLTITNDVTNTNQLTTFTLAADGGGPQTIAHGDTLAIVGSTGITTESLDTDQVRIGITSAVVQTTTDQSIGGNKTFTGITTFDAGAGFDRILAEDATDVEIDFTTGNKAHLDMTGGSIAGTLTLKFPAVSGNFVLVVQQDGSTRTINTYATKDSAGNAGNNDGGTAGAIRWTGGSPPDLTDGNNKRDVLSFYWDADEEVCYGVASLDF